MHNFYPQARAIARQAPNPEDFDETARLIYKGIAPQTDHALALRIAFEVSRQGPQQEKGEG